MQYEKEVPLANLIVHKRVTERHPELTEEGVRAAWENALVSTPRIAKDPDEYVALGFDGDGRLLEVVATRLRDGDWLIFHATTPPSDKTFRELGIERR